MLCSTELLFSCMSDHKDAGYFEAAIEGEGRLADPDLDNQSDTDWLSLRLRRPDVHTLGYTCMTKVTVSHSATASLPLHKHNWAGPVAHGLFATESSHSFHLSVISSQQGSEPSSLTTQ